MRVLIVEDETSSYQNFMCIIREMASDIEVVGNTESVAETVSWLRQNAPPDLIFMDIHLSDGSAFSIFAQTEVTVPIVFTTAYDQYALDAFRVNSIDYLLKPIKAKDIERAIDKFHRLSRIDVNSYLSRMSALKPKAQWQNCLLVPHRDTLMPINVADISYIYSTEKKTVICMNNREQYFYPKSLDATLSMLDPHQFFRANKQFVVRRESVQKITVWYDSRLLLKLNTDTPEQLFVSKNRAAEFKQWMVSG